MTPRLLTTVFALLAVCLVQAQGLYVQPTSYETTVKPGAIYDLPLQLRNNMADAVDNVEISGVYLAQDLTGFEGIEPEKMSSEDLKNFPSCLAVDQITACNEVFNSPAESAITNGPGQRSLRRTWLLWRGNCCHFAKAACRSWCPASIALRDTSSSACRVGCSAQERVNSGFCGDVRIRRPYPSCRHRSCLYG